VTRGLLKGAALPLLLIMLIVLAGCGNNENNHEGHASSGEMNMDPVLVDLLVPAEAVKVNDKVLIEVIVTQSEKRVENADHVMIEIYQEGDAKEGHEMGAAKHVGDGKYQYETALDRTGVYSVTSHVTVGPMHTMPTKQITVQE